jgi:hypothetical protein
VSDPDSRKNSAVIAFKDQKIGFDSKSFPAFSPAIPDRSPPRKQHILSASIQSKRRLGARRYQLALKSLFPFSYTGR